MYNIKKINIINIYFLETSPVGLEPTTCRLTAERDTYFAMETFYIYIYFFKSFFYILFLNKHFIQVNHFLNHRH